MNTLQVCCSLYILTNNPLNDISQTIVGDTLISTQTREGIKYSIYIYIRKKKQLFIDETLVFDFR